MAHAPYSGASKKGSVLTNPSKKKAGGVHSTKGLHFTQTANDRIQRVQDSLTAARKGKGLFGLKY